MPNLLSGSKLRKGGSGEFLPLAGAMPQLPSTTSTTGFTLITNDVLQTRYASSLGNIEFYNSTLYSNLSSGTITVLTSGTEGISYSTASGTLVVNGGVGIGQNLYVKDDINVNGLTIGQGYKGTNNIVFRGTATSVEYEFDNGQQNIAIGYDVFQGIATSYRSVAIGRYALSSGTHISNSIAIGDSALKKSGALIDTPIAEITGATQANPVIITAPGHGLPSGTYINIHDVVGMTELTTQSFYISVVSSSTFGLYLDNILTVPLNGTGYSGYSSSGTVNRVFLKDNNIAIGQSSGASLIDGTGNFFFGDKIAKNLTTGSYNFFAGRGGINITNGSNIISISGSNIVDGVDNQINFGSVFYYNGQGFTNFNSNMELGLGVESTSTDNGAAIVIGGMGVSGNINVGGELNAIGAGKVDLSPDAYSVYLQPTSGGQVTIAPSGLGSIDNMDIGLNDPAAAKFNTVDIVSTTASTSTNTGALTVAGGVGIGGDIYNINGAIDENYLLYTPQVFVSTSTPASPRIGDVWVDATNFAYLQYIKDGTSTFWLQVGAI